MKYLFILFAITLMVGCSDQPETGQEMAFRNAPVADTNIHPVLDIGGCYVYKLNADSFAAVVLTGIIKEEEVVYYSFIPGGKFFDKVPLAGMFRKEGVWGRKIPAGDIATAQRGNYVLTFSGFTITEKELKPQLNNFILVDHLDISNKLDFGFKTFISTMDDFAQVIHTLSSENERRLKDPIGMLPEYPHEIVSWDKLPLASTPAEKSVPFTRWILSKKTAHPKAVALMQEDWYWSPIDELSPFGSDDGHDALYGFKSWRDQHADQDAVLYLNELEKTWQKAFTHLDITDEKKLANVEQSTMFYREIDCEIIAVALGQIVLEARISAPLKDWGIKACQRAMTDYGMSGMDAELKKEYRSRLEKIISILNSF